MSLASHSAHLRARRAAAVFFALAFLPPPEAAQQSSSAEYRGKANFLANFPSFVDWPQSAFPSPQAPFLICVRGDFSFGTAIAEAARSSSPHGRAIEVRWVRKDEQLRDCHIAFVSRSESKRYAKLLPILEGFRVLTVGETDDFLAAGGAIAFSIHRDTLQFDVNLAAAGGAGLKISSQLLAIARHVITKTEAAKS